MTDTERREAADRVLNRGREEQLSFSEGVALQEVIDHVDPRRIPEDFWPLSLARAYRLLRGPAARVRFGGPFGPTEAAEIATVFIALPPRPAIGPNLQPVIEFVRAGIPADITIKVLSADGTLQQAQAVLNGDVPPGLSSGAL